MEFGSHITLFKFPNEIKWGVSCLKIRFMDVTIIRKCFGHLTEKVKNALEYCISSRYTRPGRPDSDQFLLTIRYYSASFHVEVKRR